MGWHHLFRYRCTSGLRVGLVAEFTLVSGLAPTGIFWPPSEKDTTRAINDYGIPASQVSSPFRPTALTAPQLSTDLSISFTVTAVLAGTLPFAGCLKVLGVG